MKREPLTMSEPRLAIPLYESVAQKRLGRIFGIVVITSLAILCGYMIDRGFRYRGANTGWPETATTEIRFIKTPRLERTLKNVFNNSQALPGSPWSLPETLDWSKREYVLYTDATSVIALKIDGQVPTESLDALKNWGWSYDKINKHQTLIYTDKLELRLKYPKRSRPFWYLWPAYEGTVSLDNSGFAVSAPWRFTAAHHLDLIMNTSRFISNNTLELPTNTQLLGAIAVPEDWQAVLLPTSVPGTFPGFQKLKTAMEGKQLDFLTGSDQQGLAFVMAMPSPNFSLEDLGAIATEGASIQDLSTTELPINETDSSLEIRSRNQISVNVSNTDGLLVATAKTTDGQIFRLTQSNDQLILSNREPFIGLESAKFSDACLSKPQGFLRARSLLEQTTALTSGPGLDIFTHLQQAQELAYTKHRLRVCW